MKRLVRASGKEAVVPTYKYLGWYVIANSMLAILSKVSGIRNFGFCEIAGCWQNANQQALALIRAERWLVGSILIRDARVFVASHLLTSIMIGR